MPEAERPAAVRLVDVTRAYGPVVAVDRLTLDVRSGEFLTLLGPSGCGKTTTLNMVAGFLRPTAGEIWLGGQRVEDLPPYRRDTAMVFQQYALFPHMTVFDNVAFGLRMRRLGGGEVRARVVAALSQVGLGGLGARMPVQLSGGQQQRVALARAIVVRPSVLLLDEPLSNLDLKLREEMRLELKRLHRDLGITAVYVTHDQTEALVLSTRIAVMRGGRIEQVDKPQAIYDRPATRFVAEFVGSTNLLRGRPAGRDGDLLAVDTSAGFRAWCRLDGGGPPGGAAADWVVISIRPEHIRAAAPAGVGSATAGPALNTVAGRVEEVVYLGGTVRYGVRLAADETVAVEEPHYPGRPVHAPGSLVRLEFDPAHCRLFGGEDAWGRQ